MNKHRQCGNIDNNKSMPRPFRWRVMRMHGKGLESWGAFEPFHIMLNDYRIADIGVSNHALNRYLERVSVEGNDENNIAAWIWQALRQKRIKPYQNQEQNAYLIDDDVVVIAQFTELEGQCNISGQPLYIMNLVTFLGRISVMPQLRDLRTYYSRLRQARRVKWNKKRRKRK